MPRYAFFFKLVCATVAAIVLLKFASPVSSGNVLGAKELFAASISACAAGTMHQCPESWKDPSQIMGYHCLHKLTRQASEAAYQSSGGACRPASDGPFPEADCQDQCSIGGEAGHLEHRRSLHQLSGVPSELESQEKGDSFEASSGSGGSGSFGGSGSSGSGSFGGSGSWHHSGSFGSGYGHSGSYGSGSWHHSGSFGSGYGHSGSYRSYHHSGSFGSGYGHSYGSSYSSGSGLPGGDSSSWTPSSSHHVIVGGDESSWAPSSSSSVIVGGDESSWAPSSSSAIVGGDSSSWAPSSSHHVIVGGDESSWAPSSSSSAIVGGDSSSWAPTSHTVVHHIVHVKHAGSSGHEFSSYGGGRGVSDENGITSCGSGTVHQCPADWKTPGNAGGYHCLHKLARQTSETAYQKSGGACRPAGHGPFPQSDCQVQCRTLAKTLKGRVFLRFQEAQVSTRDQGRTWPIRSVSALLVIGALAALFFRPTTPAVKLSGLEEKFKAHTPPCPAGKNNCPAEWNDPSHEGGYHCLYKLRSQTSEKAYQSSGGACRPASHGPFPADECQAQCGTFQLKASETLFRRVAFVSLVVACQLVVFIMFRCVILVPLAAAVRQNLLQTQEAVSQEVLEANETTQGVDAFQQWSLDTPVWAVTNNFLSRWKAIPLSASSDFILTGDLTHMVKLLQKRSDLPVECHSDFIGHTVTLVVSEVMPKAQELYLKAFMGGLVQIGGIATIMFRVAALASGSTSMAVVSTFAANPSALNLDDTIASLLSSEVLQGKHPGPYTPKTIWYWLTRKKTTAYLTLQHKPQSKHALPMAKFMCTKNEGKGMRDRPAYVAMQGEAGEMIPLTAHRLSLFILALA
eukprot:g23270.t1